MILQALDGNGPTFQWEKGGQFYPENVQRRALPTRFVDINGGTIEGKPVYSYFDVDRESVGNILGERMSFLDPSYFIAGNVYNNIDLLRKIIPDPHCEAMDWIENKVDINKSIAHFKGEFNGVSYDHSYPPARIFRNSSNCKQFVEFINLELTERLQSGAISYIGKVGEVQPPHVVSPITIEASKPRLCINLMYVNCSSRIDLKKCREEIASALNDFGNRWCKREYVEPDALKEWKVSIFKIVDQRIKFYSQNTNILPLNLNPLSGI